MKRGDYDEKEIVFDMDFLEHFKSCRAVDVDSGSPIIRVGDSKIVLRAYVWTNLLKRKVPHGFKVGIRNGNPMDVRASNLVLIDEGVRQRRKIVVEGFNDDLVRMIAPDATAYSRTSKNGEMYFVFVDFTIHRVMPALCMEPRNVSVLRPKMLLREYVWNGLSTSGDGSSGVVVPLNYDMFDVRTSNLVKVHGLSSSKSCSAPASSDVPSVVRARVPWEFMPFGLKYCFNKAQSMEGFNQSKMIDPKTKHWYLSIKADAGIDSVKVAKIEESLGACYRALVEFPGVGRFPPDSLTIDVFRTVHSRYCRAMRTLLGTQLSGAATDSVSTPSFSWTGDLTTGVYRSAAGAVGITTTGVNRAIINSSGLTVAGNIALGTVGTQLLGDAADSVSTPSFSWTGDLTTGVYRSAAGAVGITTTGVNQAIINSSGLTVVGALSTNSLSGSCINSDINSTSSTVAASSGAVKTAYDLANTANNTANNALPNTGGTVIGTITAPSLSGSCISSVVNNTSVTVAASSAAVNSYYRKFSSYYRKFSSYYRKFSSYYRKFSIYYRKFSIYYRKFNSYYRKFSSYYRKYSK
eukprot:gene7033-127_t